MVASFARFSTWAPRMRAPCCPVEPVEDLLLRKVELTGLRGKNRGFVAKLRLHRNISRTGTGSRLKKGSEVHLVDSQLCLHAVWPLGRSSTRTLRINSLLLVSGSGVQTYVLPATESRQRFPAPDVVRSDGRRQKPTAAEGRMLPSLGPSERSDRLGAENRRSPTEDGAGPASPAATVGLGRAVTGACPAPGGRLKKL